MGKAKISFEGAAAMAKVEHTTAMANTVLLLLTALPTLVVCQNLRQLGVPKPDDNFKLLLVGDSGVGVTSLLLSFVDGTFPEGTINGNPRVKTGYVESLGKTIGLHLYDPADGFATIKKLLKFHGIIVVYDVTNRKSFDSVNHWVAESSK